MNKRIQIQSNLSLLEKDLESGFINENEFKMLNSKYLQYKKSRGEEKADFLLGKLMASYYNSRFEKRLENKKSDEELYKEELQSSKDNKKQTFEEYKRKLYTESVERRKDAMIKAKRLSGQYNGLYGGVNINSCNIARKYGVADSYRESKGEEST